MYFSEQAPWPVQLRERVWQVEREGKQVGKMPRRGTEEEVEAREPRRVVVGVSRGCSVESRLDFRLGWGMV